MAAQVTLQRKADLATAPQDLMHATDFQATLRKANKIAILQAIEQMRGPI